MANNKKYWIQDALSGEENKGALRKVAMRKGLLKGKDDTLSMTDLKKLQKVKGVTSKRAHLAETLMKFDRGGIYSSDDVYSVNVFVDDKLVDTKNIRAKNQREANEMAEDMEDIFKKKHGDTLRIKVEKKYANGGGVDNIKINVFFLSEGHSDEIESNETDKIKIYSKYLHFDTVQGSVDYSDTEDNTNLKFYKDGQLVFTLKGYYDTDNDTVPTTINLDGREAVFNSHVYDGMGGVDLYEIEKEFSKALDKISTFSAVINVEGYNQYSETTEGKENAESLIQDIKGKTKFQVVKGDVGEGKLINDNEVVGQYANGGGVGKFSLQELDSKFQSLDWRDTTEAYYGLDYTPFMNVIEEYLNELGYSLSGLDEYFQSLDWRDTTEAYYGLDFTPFISSIEEYASSKYANGGRVWKINDVDEWTVIDDWASWEEMHPMYNVSYGQIVSDMASFPAFFAGDSTDDEHETWKERYNLKVVDAESITKLENELWNHLLEKAKSENAFEDYVKKLNDDEQKSLLDIPENYIYIKHIRDSRDKGGLGKYIFRHRVTKKELELPDWVITEMGGAGGTDIGYISSEKALNNYFMKKQFSNGGGVSADELRRTGEKVTLSFEGKKSQLSAISEYVRNMWYFDEENFSDYGNEIYFYEIEFRDAEHIREWVKNKYEDVEVSISYDGEEYANGGGVEEIEYTFFDSETLMDEYYVENLPDGKKRVYFIAKYWVLDMDGNNTWEIDAFVGHEDFDSVENIDEIKNIITKEVLRTKDFNRALGHRTKITSIEIISKDEHIDFLRESEEEKMERKKERDYDDDDYAKGGGVGQDMYLSVKMKIASIVGIDRAMDVYSRDYSIDPFTLITMAINKGFITLDEVNDDIFQSAIYEAESVTETYRDSGEGIGSSDINSFIYNMLTDAGVNIVVENGRYVRKYNKGGEVVRELSNREKAEMYSWIDKKLMKDDWGSKDDLYEAFAIEFGRTLSDSEDIIDNGWALSRGANKNKYSNGGKVHPNDFTWDSTKTYTEEQLLNSDFIRVSGKDSKNYYFIHMNFHKYQFEMLPNGKLKYNKTFLNVPFRIISNSYLLEEKDKEVFELQRQGTIDYDEETNLTPEQYKLVRTPEFKAWFGDWENSPETSSYAVDENGEPEVFYHGSPDIDKIDVFKSNKGFDYTFFSNDLVEALRYTPSGNDSSKVKSFFINSRKMFDAENLTIEEEDDIRELLNDDSIQDAFFKHIEDMGFSDIDYYKEEFGHDYESDDDEFLLDVFTRDSENWVLIEHPIIQNYIKSNGYDSFTTLEGGVRNIAVYNSNQIKLADGTNTTFDSNNPDIRYEIGGEVTLTTEQVEKMLGRKLHWWKDDEVVVDGQLYKKCYLKPYYKLKF